MLCLPTPQPTFLCTHSWHLEYMCPRWHHQVLGPRPIHTVNTVFGAPFIRRAACRVSLTLCPTRPSLTGNPISPAHRHRVSLSVPGDAFLCSSNAAGISNPTVVLVYRTGTATANFRFRLPSSSYYRHRWCRVLERVCWIPQFLPYFHVEELRTLLSVLIDGNVVPVLTCIHSIHCHCFFNRWCEAQVRTRVLSIDDYCNECTTNDESKRNVE